MGEANEESREEHVSSRSPSSARSKRLTLDGEDGASSGEEGGVVHIGGSSEVGSGTDRLEDAGGGDEGLHRGEGGSEVVLALGDTGGSKGANEEVDVSLLLEGNGAEAVVDLAGEASSAEVIRAELGESLLQKAGQLPVANRAVVH